MRSEPWQLDEVVHRLREAGDTVRRLPRPRGPAQFGSGWPDIVRDAREAYGYEEPRLRPPAPTPRAIDRMDEVFTWFAMFEDRVDEMRAVWFAACLGVSFSQTGRILGINRKTVRSRVWAGVQSIVAGLNRNSAVTPLTIGQKSTRIARKSLSCRSCARCSTSRVFGVQGCKCASSLN